ncbi:MULTISPECIES: hypothetical protein [unclassified Methylophilus]|jgi:hypothetical protein|uniref:hypothetical protein n=1 Tax=unclassified Methylophilus TaxID=2630143 RepID=UPI000380B1B3|nr:MULTISPECIES: hypothetical protein [unclassified Methylophilus]HCU84018.1 hypothetical protein [Methylophilus sp.]
MYRWVGLVAWAWVIVIGGLMITPGGVHCIVCGDKGNLFMGVISIVLGAVAIVTNKVFAR